MHLSSSLATEAPRHRDSVGHPQYLCASVARRRIWRCVWLVAALCGGWLSPVAAQQLIDRVLVRVNGAAITQTDLQAAVGLGVVAGDETAALEQLIDRELLLAEVARFTPPEPPPAAIEMELAAMKARVGARLPALMQTTGVDEQRLRELARDTLRIQAYLTQRFGVTASVTDDDVLQYYRAHAAEFTREGRLQPFEAVEIQARQRAAAERRGTVIAQWVRDLRNRADVVLTARTGRP
jgi:hypothetical protein